MLYFFIIIDMLYFFIIIDMLYFFINTMRTNITISILWAIYEKENAISILYQVRVFSYIALNIDIVILVRIVLIKEYNISIMLLSRTLCIYCVPIYEDMGWLRLAGSLVL